MARSATETLESSPTPTFQEAYAAAKETHAAPAPEAPAPAAAAGAEDDDDPVVPAVPDVPAPAPKAAEKPARAAKPEPEGETLISEEEFSALQKTHGTDPVQLKRALDKVFTQKTQKLAEARKEYERLQPYAALIDAYEQDNRGTLAQLADDLGFTLTPKGEIAPKAGETPAVPADAAQAFTEELRTSLGPELEYLADGLAPALLSMMEKHSKSMIERETAPLRERTDALLSKSAVDQTKTIMDAFETAHPGWKEHEAAMMKIAQRMQPAKGTSEKEYLEDVYQLATREAFEKDFDTRVQREAAAATKKALEKMEQGARTHETRTAATPGELVTAAAPANASFRDAYEAAKRGERWE